MNIEENSGDKASRKEKRERTKSRIEGDQVGSTAMKSVILRKVILSSTRWKLPEVVGRVPTSFPGIMIPNWSTESM